jgi:hypothetical protein
MSTATANETLRFPRLTYGHRVRNSVIAAAAAVTLTAGILIAADDSGTTTSAAAPPQSNSRVGFEYEATQATAVQASQAFTHRTGQTLRTTPSSQVSTAQSVERFHHR